jgi:hypothetical protein
MLTTPTSHNSKNRPSLTPRSQFSNTISYKITPEEMWQCVKGSSQNWGIEGYEIAKKYYDYHQVKWQQERKRILDQHKRVWPPQNWPKAKDEDKLVPPHRRNFIDDYIKWATSYNDEKQSEERKQSLMERGTFKMPEPKKPLNLREKFLNDEKEKKEKFAALPKIQPWKEGPIDDAKKNIEEQRSKEKTQWQKDKERYSKDKPQWPRCERVSVLSDAQYIGENIPFYYTFTKEGEEVDKKNLFFPKKTFTWRRYPHWAFQGKSPTKLPTDSMKTRDDLIKEKIDNLKNNKNISDKDIMGDVILSYAKVKNRGKNYFTYKKPYDYANTEQYKINLEKHPSYSPGPQHYWKMKDIDKNERPKEVQEETEIHGKPGKIYYMNHKRTDFREVKPMRKSVF